MVIINNEWNQKEELPTIRFWLMTKIVFGWDKRYNIYKGNLQKRLIEMMSLQSPLTGSKSTESSAKVKEKTANHMIEKLELSAWRTMPSEFLRNNEIPRVLHR